MILRTRLWVLLWVATLLAASCTLPGSRERSGDVPNRRDDIPVVTPRPSPTRTPIPAPAATVVEPTPTPTATPTVQPTPVPVPREIASCCGLFAWVNGDTLIVFDTAGGDSTGTWLVSGSDGSRRFLFPGFGLPSPAELIAVPVPSSGVTELRQADGSLVSTLDNGGTRAWPSLDGSQVAWLERMPKRTPSSSVNRSVRLWVSSADGADARPVLDLQAAGLHWLPDHRHVVVAARGVDGEAPGIWVLDTQTGTYRVLVDSMFVQAVQLSPDGRSVAYLSTFSGDPRSDGVWVASVDDGERWRVPVTGSFRWGGDSETLWRLELGDGSSASDVIVEVDVSSGRERRRVPLEGRVLNSTWEISPDGRFVVYWRESDRKVVLLPLTVVFGTVFRTCST